jgi:hypothetical protein
MRIADVNEESRWHDMELMRLEMRMTAFTVHVTFVHTAIAF